jgi:hypothetical protein
MALRASVVAGRLVVDEATELPEGTVIDLVMDDEGDDLSAAERASLDDALSESRREADLGQTRDATALLDELRELRGRR